MLKILIASEDGERLADLARLVAAAGSYQVMHLHAAPAACPRMPANCAARMRSSSTSQAVAPARC